MAYLTSTIAKIALANGPLLRCNAATWKAHTTELHQRTESEHESGAFLLGKKIGSTRQILEFVYYDDIDPSCFSDGIVEFDGAKLGVLWSKCRDLQLTW